jgi:[ribosomal protein S18]-alanine N-acetyltransferase
MNYVEIRRATAADLDEIARIQALAREAPVWNPSAYLEYDCRVAVIGGRIAGFIVSREIAPPHERAEREILNIAVDPAFRRTGIGRALVESELALTQAATWFLEVRESNVAAINLYTAMGFQPAGHRKNYYHDPDETAIVMRFFS